MVHTFIHSTWFPAVTVAVASVAAWCLLAFPLIRRKLNRQHVEQMSMAARYHQANMASYRRILIAQGVDPDDNSDPASWGRYRGVLRAGSAAGVGPAQRGQPGAGAGEDTEVLPGRPYLARRYAGQPPAGDVDATRADGGQWASFYGRYSGEPSAPGTIRYSDWPADDLGNTLGAFPWGDGAQRHR
jgi:hypothetical protein